VVPVAEVRNAIESGFRKFGWRAQVGLIRAYRTAGDQLGGLAKVSVEAVPGQESPETFPADESKKLFVLAKRAQHEVRQSLLGLADGTGRRSGPVFAEHEVDVRVAWGERWLGSPP
jgi:hypothetical protein